MKVTFYKQTEQRSSYWEAVRGKRTVVPGSRMVLGRKDMPQDLKQLVAEVTAALTEMDRIWAGLAAEGDLTVEWPSLRLIAPSSAK